MPLISKCDTLVSKIFFNDLRLRKVLLFNMCVCQVEYSYNSILMVHLFFCIFQKQTHAFLYFWTTTFAMASKRTLPVLMDLQPVMTIKIHSLTKKN